MSTNKEERSTLDPMEQLKDGYNKCFFSDGILRPCKYHITRSESKIFTISDNGGCSTLPLAGDERISTLDYSEDANKLISDLNQGENLAGGWWLIPEQRDWLQTRLTEIFSSFKNDKENKYLMVSGVAGYAHFYSYLKIVFNAAKAGNFPLERLYIDVVDSCITPILEIAHIEKSIKNDKSLFGSGVKSSYDILGYNLKIPAANEKFIKELLQDLKVAHIRTFHCNILNLGDYCELMRKKYNIITEHFLISMMENSLLKTARCRESYQTMAREGCHLLIATGLPGQNPNQYLADLTEVHNQYGFKIQMKDSVKVWDPYGIQKNVLDAISNDFAIDKRSNRPIILDNALIHFTYQD